MSFFDWDNAQNKRLRAGCGIGFEDALIERGDLLDVLESHQLCAHDVICGIAGDRGAGNACELDAVAPDNEFLVRDADSTQQQAIALALKGRNGVISGPPGTGKSQTIANLIAEYAARGKPHRPATVRGLLHIRHMAGAVTGQGEDELLRVGAGAGIRTACFTLTM